MRYMNDVYMDGFPTAKIKMGKYYYFMLYNPISKEKFMCKTKLKIMDKIESEIFIGIKGSLQSGNTLVNPIMINVNKIKLYGIEGSDE